MNCSPPNIRLNEEDLLNIISLGVVLSFVIVPPLKFNIKVSIGIKVKVTHLNYYLPVAFVNPGREVTIFLKSHLFLHHEVSQSIVRRKRQA